MPDYKAIYREHARQYDLLVSREDYQGNILRSLTRIRSLEGLDVVEFGAGTGRLTCMLAPLVNTILAFDISKTMLDVAADKLKKTHLQNWTVIVGDNRNLPVADQSADLSIAGWSFGHSTEWYPETWGAEVALALEQLLRVLKPGGTAIILETLGTGQETPQPPSETLAKFYSLLENEYRFTATWIRTDYRFDSLKEAEDITRFFFGDSLADRVTGEGLITLPECTGIWALTI